MFTGLIKEIGILTQINKLEKGLELIINVESDFFYDTEIGDSISVNGVCLTIEGYNQITYKRENNNSKNIKSKTATFVCTGETYAVSNLKYQKISDKVNLEKALRLSDRLDGHIVTGHVESVAKIIDIKRYGNSSIFRFSLPEECKRYICYKSSIAINGISLTVSNITLNDFEVTLIDQTIGKTNLQYLKSGDYVNIETDIFAKYVEKILSFKDNKISLKEKLKTCGFM